MTRFDRRSSKRRPKRVGQSYFLAPRLSRFHRLDPPRTVQQQQYQYCIILQYIHITEGTLSDLVRSQSNHPKGELHLWRKRIFTEFLSLFSQSNIQYSGLLDG